MASRQLESTFNSKMIPGLFVLYGTKIKFALPIPTFASLKKLYSFLA